MMVYLSQLESLEEMRQIMLCHGLGLESYEFAIGGALDRLENSISIFENTFRSLFGGGLSLHGPFLDLNPASFEPLVQKATSLRFEQCYQAAKQLGARKIVFHTGFFPQICWTACWVEKSIAFWQEFLQDKDDSILICLENHHDPQPGPIAQVLDEVDHPSFWACLDVGHANVWSKVPATDWLHTLGGRIRHLHWSNNDGTVDSHSALHQGTLDISVLMEQAQLVAPMADWVLEVNSLKAAEESLAWMGKLQGAGKIKRFA